MGAVDHIVSAHLRGECEPLRRQVDGNNTGAHVVGEQGCAEADWTHPEDGDGVVTR